MNFGEKKLNVDSVAGVPYQPNHAVRSMLLDRRVATREPDNEDSRRLLTIRVADSQGHRSSAHILVTRMYEARGYSVAPLPDTPTTNRITLIATDHDVTIGTITVGFDGQDGLLVEELFADEIAQLRSEGAVLCEFIKLAIDGVVRSKKVLASLMHAAFICAREMEGCNKVVIEVNPRHVHFYQAMLGFSVLVSERHNRRVNAPAVLMSLDLDFADGQIDSFQSGGSVRRDADRSLYRHSFSRQETAAVVDRMRRRVEAA